MSETPDHSFESAVAAYYQNLFKFACSLAKNTDDAADLTQQTFLIYARKGHSLRESAKLKSWLFTTLYREFLRQNRRGKATTAVDQEILETYTDDAGAIDQVRRMEGGEALSALQQLDPVFREPLTLFYLEDLAYKEIAEVLDIPIGTVMSRLSRGKEQLKSRLANAFAE